MKIIIIPSLGSAYFMKNGELMQTPIEKYGLIDTSSSASVDNEYSTETLVNYVDLPNWTSTMSSTWGDLRAELIKELQ